ncbi:MAG TPA: polysaccharide pyruvyl transferase family protein [Methanolinea sp.]|nr:polysaccharide pyruvyl transferase family protein [Methanolinea sp.]
MSIENKPLFILAGNGPYENRGCEAIVRGTVKILRNFFPDPSFICISHFQSEMQYKEQCLNETDKAILHLASYRINKRTVIQTAWKMKTWKALSKYFLNRDEYYASFYNQMLPFIQEAKAILSVGGDNYSLDYGIPNRYIALDNLTLSYKKPIILWGASVGPFGAIPDFERFMSGHLQKVTGIFARESATIDYLEKIGVTKNVFPVADPAFLMDPQKPVKDIVIEDETIGINFSPLMAKFVSGGDMGKWKKLAASIITGIVNRTDMQVFLIPHVTSHHSNDFVFLNSITKHIKNENKKVILLSNTYSAAEIKWIIGQMTIFAGSRTHANIAALSSCIPTLSFGYSIKSLGINKDIFGHTKYCMKPQEMDEKIIVDMIINLLDNNTTIRSILEQRLPEIHTRAFDAGIKLHSLLKEN